MNKEQGMMNIEGRKCSMLNFQYSMFNEERWNWELGYWGLGESPAREWCETSNMRRERDPYSTGITHFPILIIL